MYHIGITKTEKILELGFIDSAKTKRRESWTRTLKRDWTRLVLCGFQGSLPVNRECILESFVYVFVACRTLMRGMESITFIYKKMTEHHLDLGYGRCHWHYSRKQIVTGINRRTIFYTRYKTFEDFFFCESFRLRYHLGVQTTFLFWPLHVSIAPERKILFRPSFQQKGLPTIATGFCCCSSSAVVANSARFIAFLAKEESDETKVEVFFLHVCMYTLGRQMRTYISRRRKAICDGSDVTSRHTIPIHTSCENAGWSSDCGGAGQTSEPSWVDVWWLWDCGGPTVSVSSRGGALPSLRFLLEEHLREKMDVRQVVDDNRIVMRQDRRYGSS